jgi:hypothetical protein
MKHLLRALSLTALVLVVGLTSYAIYNRYEDYAAKQRHSIELAESQQRQVIAEAQAAQATIDKLTDDYNSLHAECLKGVTAHNGLTLANKQRFAAPTCGTAK